MSIVRYGDTMSNVWPLGMTVGALVLIGFIGSAGLMRWIKGRAQWHAEPPRPKAAVFCFVLCVLVLPALFHQLWTPVHFELLEIHDGKVTFRKGPLWRSTSVPLERISQIEFLDSGRLAFWFDVPKSVPLPEQLEVTRVLYTGDHQQYLQRTENALHAAGWQGEVVALDFERR